MVDKSPLALKFVAFAPQAPQVGGEQEVIQICFLELSDRTLILLIEAP